MDYIDLFKEFGPLIGIVLFFIWRDWKREDKLVERVEKLEEYQQETLAALVKENITVIAANTQQMKWVSTLIQSCHSGRVLQVDENDKT
jgi:hypothetical protein